MKAYSILCTKSAHRIAAESQTHRQVRKLNSTSVKRKALCMQMQHLAPCTHAYAHPPPQVRFISQLSRHHAAWIRILITKLEPGRQKSQCHCIVQGAHSVQSLSASVRAVNTEHTGMHSITSTTCRKHQTPPALTSSSSLHEHMGARPTLLQQCS